MEMARHLGHFLGIAAGWIAALIRDKQRNQKEREFVMKSEDKTRRQFARAMAQETFKRNYWNDELMADVAAANRGKTAERSRMVEARKAEWVRKQRMAAQEKARVAAVIAAKKAEMAAAPGSVEAASERDGAPPPAPLDRRDAVTVPRYSAAVRSVFIDIECYRKPVNGVDNCKSAAAA